MKFRHRRLERAALDSRLDAGERTALLTGAAHKPATALRKPLKNSISLGPQKRIVSTNFFSLSFRLPIEQHRQRARDI